jgi:ligand-binding sensor domain-containing protein
VSAGPVDQDGSAGRRRGGRFEPVTIPGAPPGLRVTSRCVDPAGGLWVGSSSGVFHLARQRAAAYSMANGLPDDRVISLVADRDGALWIGT